MNLESLSREKKQSICIKVAEAAKKYIVSEETTCVDEAIALCNDYINKKEVSVDLLYDYLDNEENGFTILQECTEDEIEEEAWNCIIYAVAIICKDMYSDAGAVYLPEPIELVDEDTLGLMIDSFIMCDENNASLVESYINN